MAARGIIAMVGVGAVAACASAPAPVALPMETGHAITAKGAVPVRGQTIAVKPYAYDQGKPAKDEAQAVCTARGMTFNPTAVGRYAAPEWIFAGACA